VAAGSMESGAAAMARLQDISTKTQTSISASADVFMRLNASMRAMGGTQEDTLRLTETLAKAIKVSGASAEEAKNAMLQFGQAMGSGKLQGDELRSLLENAPYLMRKLAEGIGVPIGALKSLGEQGKLTADVVAAALAKASAQIETDFAQMPQTVAGALAVMEDAAKRANEKLDELTGTSVVLTGATKGLGQVLDSLAKQFGAANEQAGAMGRNEAVKGWADTTRLVLSYVADAADLTWQTLSVLGRNVAFVFEGVGSEIGGIAAQVVAVARGDFAGAKAIGEAMKADADKRRAELDAADEKTLARTRLAGQAMREAWEQGAGGGRGSINPATAPSKLTPTAPDKPKKAEFDQAAYLADLRKKQDSEIQVINDTEAERLRIAKKHLDEKKISEAAYAEAVKLINKGAEDDRIALMQKTQEHIDKQREQDANKTKQAWEEKKRGEKAVADYVLNLTKAVDPIAALEVEYQAKLALVTQYEELMAAAGVDATLRGEQARTEISNTYEKQRLALAEQSFASQGEAQAFLMNSINALGQSASGAIMGLIDHTMTAQDVMRSLARTILQEAIGSVVQLGVAQVKNAILGQSIAAAKGAAYATSVSAQVAGMSALAAQNAFAATAAIPIVGPGLAPAAAATAAAAASALGAPAVATAPVAGARRYGGTTTGGSLYRINESGAPEMFTASNGNQYMMSSSSGRVTSADKVGGSGAPTIIINNAPPGTSASYDNSSNTVTVAVAQAVAAVSGQIRDNSGPVWSAMRSSTNVQGRL